MQTVLTIAGFDPSSGAGITADLMVFAAHGLFGTACVTSLTVQSTAGVTASHPVSDKVVLATLRCLAADLPPAGIKIGMLGSAGNVEAVGEFVASLRAGTGAPVVVLDPVVRSSSGRELLGARGLTAMRSCLLPLIDWVTPNLDELALLTGRPVANRGEMGQAARFLREMNRSTGLNILAKGGHLERPDDLLLESDGTETWLQGERIATQATHGTGCALSSALLSLLVLGGRPVAAALGAKRYVAEAMRQAVPLGRGPGPLRHLWPLLDGSKTARAREIG